MHASGSSESARSFAKGRLRAAALADLVAIVYGCLLSSVLAFDGFRLRFDGYRIRIDSARNLIIGLAAVLVLRHILVRCPTILDRARQFVRAARASRAARMATVIGLISRVTVLTVALLAVIVIGRADSTPGGGRAEPLGVRDVFSVWDGGWYLATAAHGYHEVDSAERMQNAAFFPAYPMLMRTVGAFLGARVLYTDSRENVSREFTLEQERTIVIAGLAISLVAFIWGLTYVYRLARELVDDEAAERAIALLSWYPFAFFYGAVYTESLFLLALSASLYHAIKSDWARALPWGLLAGLTRPVGFVLCAPLAWVAFEQMRRDPRARTVSRVATRFGSIAAPVAGVALFSWYHYASTGSAVRWLEAQGAWGRFDPRLGLLSVVADRASLVAADGPLAYVRAQPIELLNATATVLAVVLIVPIAVRLGIAYALLPLLILVPPLFAGGFLSTGRFTAPMFPLFIYMATWPRPATRALVPVFACLQGLLAAVHFTGRPLY